MSCSGDLLGPYCQLCSEKRLNRHNYRLVHFLEHAFDAVTHLDLRVVQDVGAQLRRPGAVAAAWLQGQREAHAYLPFRR